MPTFNIASARGRRNAKGLAAAGVAVLVAIGACGHTTAETSTMLNKTADSPTTEAAPTEAGPALQLVCSDMIQIVDAPSPGRTVIDDALTIDTQNFVPVRHGESGAEAYFAKQGIEIRTDSIVEVRVVGTSIGEARIGWGSTPLGPVEVIQIPGCPPEPQADGNVPESQWHAYAGGIWVAEPMCVELAVRTAVGVTVLEIPVGADCGEG